MKEKKEVVATLQQKERVTVKERITYWKGKIREAKREHRRKRYENGEVELPVFRVGPNKKGMVVLWLLMAASLAFGVYKNFTAIDKETIHETKVVETKVADTNEIESFVERFAYVYHTWGNDQESKNTRIEMLGAYMTDTLVKLNNGMISGECPTSAAVLNARVCEVEDVDGTIFKVRYSVKQSFEETVAEEVAEIEKKELPVVATGTDVDTGEEGQTVDVEDGFKGTQSGDTAADAIPDTEDTELTEMTVSEENLQEETAVTTKYGAAVTSRTETISNGDGSKTVLIIRESFYEVELHVDEDGSMVIVTNPTACGIPRKSSYVPPEYQNDGSVDTTARTEIEDFLNTFFSLYPAATEKELTYYAVPGIMDVIGTDYVYDGLYNATYYKEDDAIKVHTYVRYLDQTAKITQISEYTLTLEKGENWKIVGVK